MRKNIEINCPSCNQQVNIPKGMFVLFTCPNCDNEFEIDGRIKRVSKKKYFIWLFLMMFSALFLGAFMYYNNTKKTVTEKNISSNDGKTPGRYKNLKNDDIYQTRLNSLISAVDITNETTNDYAVRLASSFPGTYNIAQVCKIFDHIVKKWKYVNDSDKMENYRSASRTINNNLSGDCDDFAILLSALIESIGGHTRISFAYNEQGGHAFTEVLVAKNKQEMKDVIDDINALYRRKKFNINYTTDKNGRCWINLDWFGKPQHPGGQYFDYDYRSIYYPTLDNPTYEQE
jgi:hypothetical protein